MNDEINSMMALVLSSYIDYWFYIHSEQYFYIFCYHLNESALVSNSKCLLYYSNVLKIVQSFMRSFCK